MRLISAVDFFGVNFTPIWGGGFTNAMELAAIGRLILAGDVKRVLEIGVNMGETARALLEAFPQIESYTGVDITGEGPGSMHLSSLPEERAFADSEVGSLALHDPRFRVYMSSGGSGDYRPTTDYDLVFVDGNHSYDWVRRDTVLARTVNPGIIVWHDVDLCDVARAVDEEPEAVHIQDTGIAFVVLRDKAYAEKVMTGLAPDEAEDAGTRGADANLMDRLRAR